ncbi:MAG: aminotransferase class I/II-fold pyridoxal phosphate-dependent enzyme [Spirochaetota bacterium]|nr:aminotransferase class I/II-fold pyridoxal phosphate-dependent enzyme [Spirochaetota bacterium]
MRIEPFKLERFFAAHEFNVRYQMSASDCESMTVEDLLRYGGEDQIDELKSLQLGYTESPGHPHLREAISRLYRRAPTEGVLVAVPEEAIFLTLQAHLKQGDHVIVMSPAYQSLQAVPEAIGCRVSRWQAELQEGRWRLDFNFLRDALSADTKMVIINIPHNPTGLCLSLQEKKDLVEILRPYGTLLLADEMYWKLEYDPGVSSEPFCDLYEYAVSLSGLSKSYGLPGLRIGWLASQTAGLLDPVAALKDYTTICSSAPSELLAGLAVEHSDELTGRGLDIVRKNLDAAARMADNHPVVELIPGQGSSVIFPRFRDGRSATDFSERLIEKRSLLMLPGPLFDMPDGFFRLGLGRTALPEALRIFEEEIE